MTMLKLKRSGTKLMLTLGLCVSMTGCTFLDKLTGKQTASTQAATKTTTTAASKCKIQNRPDASQVEVAGTGSSLEAAIDEARLKCSADPLVDCREMRLTVAIHRVFSKYVEHGETISEVDTSIGPVTLKELTDPEDGEGEDYYTIAAALPKGNE